MIFHVFKNGYDVRTLFLVCSASFIFTLPLVSFPALFHLNYVLLMVSGGWLLYRQKLLSLKELYQDKEIIFALSFVLIVFLGGLLHVESFWDDKRGALWSARVFLQTFSVFIVFKLISFKHKEAVTFILCPLVLSSYVLLLIGLYKFYMLPPSLFTYINSDGELVSRFYIFNNPNLSAIFATLSLGFVIPFCGDSCVKARYIAYAGVLALFLTLLFLGSRLGIMIFCVLCAVYVWSLPYISKKVKWGVLFVGVIILIVFFVVNIEVLMLKILYGQEIRPIIFKVGWDHYLQQGHYILGIGSGEFFKIDFTPFLGEEYKRIYHAHNLFLHFLIENGMMGLICYLMFWFFVMNRVIKKRHTVLYDPIGYKAFWLIALAHLLFSLVEATFFYRNAIWLVLLIAIASGIYKEDYKEV